MVLQTPGQVLRMRESCHFSMFLLHIEHFSLSRLTVVDTRLELCEVCVLSTDTLRFDAILL